MFNVGHDVHVTNGYGIYLGEKKIVGTEESDGKTRYFLSPSDTPWFSHSESSLSSVEPPSLILIKTLSLSHEKFGVQGGDGTIKVELPARSR